MHGDNDRTTHVTRESVKLPSEGEKEKLCTKKIVGGAPLTRVIESGYVDMEPLQYHYAVEVLMSGTEVRPPLALKAV